MCWTSCCCCVVGVIERGWKPLIVSDIWVNVPIQRTGVGARRSCGFQGSKTGLEDCTDVLENLIKGGFLFLWYFSPDDMVDVTFDFACKRGAEGADLRGKFGPDDDTVSLSVGKFVSNARAIRFRLLNFLSEQGHIFGSVIQFTSKIVSQCLKILIHDFDAAGKVDVQYSERPTEVCSDSGQGMGEVVISG